MFRIFSQYLPTRTLFLIVFENLLIGATIRLVAMMRLSNSQYSVFEDQGVLFKVITITLICQLCLYFHDLYDLRIVKDSRELFVRLLQAFGVCSILVAAVYSLFPRMFLGRGVFVVAVIILLCFFIAWRVAFLWINQKRGLKQSMLIVGTGELAKRLAAEILCRPDVGIQIVGFATEDRPMIGKSLLNPKVLGHVSEIATIVARERVDGIVVAMPESRGKLPVAELLDMKMKGISVEEATTLYEKVTGKIAVENLRPSWLIFSQGFRKSKLTHFYKRLFGVVFSILGLLLFLPVMIVIALLIKLDSAGPVFFRQERVGENGEVFRLLKFRSMFENAETDTGPIWALENDRRITRVGRFIRRVRFDELPQFVNVLWGEMSFVGLRPERPHFVRQLNEKIPYYNQRHSLKTGITGSGQSKDDY